MCNVNLPFNIQYYLIVIPLLKIALRQKRWAFYKFSDRITPLMATGIMYKKIIFCQS